MSRFVVTLFLLAAAVAAVAGLWWSLASGVEEDGDEARPSPVASRPDGATHGAVLLAGAEARADHVEPTGGRRSVAPAASAPDVPGPIGPLEVDVHVVDVEGAPVDGAIVWGLAMPGDPTQDSRPGGFDDSWSRGWLSDREAARMSEELRRDSSPERGGVPLDFDFQRELLTRTAPVQSVAGRATLHFWSDALHDELVVKAGGPQLPPVERRFTQAEAESGPIELVLPPFGTLVVALETPDPTLLVVPGRCASVPDDFEGATFTAWRAPLELPLVGVGEELDVHVLAADESTRVSARVPHGGESHEQEGLIDFDVELIGRLSVEVLDEHGTSKGQLRSDALRAPVVTRVRGPERHGERRVVTVARGPLLVALQGTLVDAEDWNLGNFDAVFTLESAHGTHRYRQRVESLGEFTLVLPATVADERPYRLSVEGRAGSFSTQTTEHLRLDGTTISGYAPPQLATTRLGALRPGPNPLGKLVLGVLPPLVSGRVVDTAGEPVEGAVLALFERDGEGGVDTSSWRALPGPPPGSWRTDSTGRFELLGHAPEHALAVHVRAAVEAGVEPVEFTTPWVGLELVVE